MRCLKRSSPGTWCVAALFFLLATGPVIGQTLQVRTVVWGFDGKVSVNRFNPVSIELDNTGEEAFDGVVVLRAKSGGLGQAYGARLRSQVYLQPQGRRWVQFTPYIHPQPETATWEIRWTDNKNPKARGQANLPQAKAGKGAFVALTRSSGLGGGIKGLRNFDEEIFPGSVSGTSPLGSVVLDHVPRWEAPRREAFFDWVWSGGHVHLLKNDDDEFPKFSDNLSLLNGPNETQAVGLGAVFRYQKTRDQINRMRSVPPPQDGDTKAAGENAKQKPGNDFLAQAKAREDLFHSVPGEGSDKELDEIIRNSGTDSFNNYSNLQFGWNASSVVHSQLMEMTRPDHDWGLIYFCLLYTSPSPRD